MASGISMEETSYSSPLKTQIWPFLNAAWNMANRSVSDKLSKIPTFRITKRVNWWSWLGIRTKNSSWSNMTTAITQDRRRTSEQIEVNTTKNAYILRMNFIRLNSIRGMLMCLRKFNYMRCKTSMEALVKLERNYKFEWIDAKFRIYELITFQLLKQLSNNDDTSDWTIYFY